MGRGRAGRRGVAGGPSGAASGAGLAAEAHPPGRTVAGEGGGGGGRAQEERRGQSGGCAGCGVGSCRVLSRPPELPPPSPSPLARVPANRKLRV